MRVGVFTDSFDELSLDEVLTWLESSAPEIRDLEIGTSGYSPARHCELEALVEDESERTAWRDALTERGFRVSALNVSGNPLELADHDHDLRRTIELAHLVGVERIVCMSGGRASLSAGGGFPASSTRSTPTGGRRSSRTGARSPGQRSPSTACGSASTSSQERSCTTSRRSSASAARRRASR
jgi:sugar phosphate isomerase/epimerase